MPPIAQPPRPRSLAQSAVLFVRRLADRVSRSEQQRQLDHLVRVVDAIAAQQKQDQKWRMIFRRQLNAIVRSHYVLDSPIPAPRALSARRFRLHSQNEEDGVTLALLEAAGVTTRRFVEIGSGGSGGNSAVLAFEFGWSGLMVDASKEAIAALRYRATGYPGVTVIHRFVTTDTVNHMLDKHGLTGEIDFLSIDVDSIDYWLLEALSVCSPRVLVMEYNALFGPERRVTLPNAPVPKQAPKGYTGASLAALTTLAERKGYRLVLCEEAGINAFFLRHDVAPSIPGITVADAYRPWLERRDLDDRLQKDIDIFQVTADAGLPLVEV